MTKGEGQLQEEDWEAVCRCDEEGILRFDKHHRCSVLPIACRDKYLDQGKK